MEPSLHLLVLSLSGSKIAKEFFVISHNSLNLSKLVITTSSWKRKCAVVGKMLVNVNFKEMISWYSVCNCGIVVDLVPLPIIMNRWQFN